MISETIVISKKKEESRATSLNLNPVLKSLVIMKPAERIMISREISKRIIGAGGFNYLIRSLIVK